MNATSKRVASRILAIASLAAFPFIGTVLAFVFVSYFVVDRDPHGFNAGFPFLPWMLLLGFGGLIVGLIVAIKLLAWGSSTGVDELVRLHNGKAD